MAKKTFKQFQNDAKGLDDKQFAKLLDKKKIKRPDILKKIREESLADRMAAAAKRNKGAIKNKRGVAPVKKPAEPSEPELKAVNPEAERIVRGMERKSLGRFKSLYGRRHKDVMYNTANKLAS